MSLLDQKNLEEIKILIYYQCGRYVSKTMFYSNFENLDSLLESVVESLLCELDNQLQKKKEQGHFQLVLLFYFRIICLEY